MASLTKSRKTATYEELAEVPDNKVAEIVEGDLYVSPRQGPRHADASSGIVAALRGPFDRARGGPGGWRILVEPELHLRADVLVPDIAGWRRERLPHLPEEAYFPVAPDWVCEVVSPSTVALDRVTKQGVYAREGVSYAWLVDPIARTIEVLRLADGRWVILSTCAGAETVGLEPFDALEFELTLLWEVSDK